MFIGRLVILFLLGFSLQATSATEQQITGAFGLTLGDTYDTQGIYGKKSRDSGFISYPYKPKTNFRSFTKYNVSITPSTKKIFLIAAIAVFRNSSDCEDELDQVSSMLGEKYGPPLKTTDRFDLNNTTALIEQQENGRQIFLKCSRLRSMVKLDIVYSDTRLMSLSEQEHEEMGR